MKGFPKKGSEILLVAEYRTLNRFVYISTCLFLPAALFVISFSHVKKTWPSLLGRVAPIRIAYNVRAMVEVDFQGIPETRAFKRSEGISPP
jgi:hypothetical protein